MKQERRAKTVESQPSVELTFVAAAVRKAVTLALKEDETDLAIVLALREAALMRIPEQGAALWEFITGPLRNTLQTYANSDDATRVVERLLQLLAPQIARVNEPQANVSGVISIIEPAPQSARIEFVSGQPGSPFSDDEPTRQISADAPFSDDQPTRQIPVDAPALDGTLRETWPVVATQSASVLMLTDDKQVSLRLSLILGASIVLKTYFNLSLFIQALDAEELVETVVVLDFRSARLTPTALATLTARLRHDSSVVLWGDSAAMEAQLQTLGQTLPQGWVRCSLAMQPDDISALIRCAITPVVGG